MVDFPKLLTPPPQGGVKDGLGVMVIVNVLVAVEVPVAVDVAEEVEVGV